MPRRDASRSSRGDCTPYRRRSFHHRQRSNSPARPVFQQPTRNGLSRIPGAVQGSNVTPPCGPPDFQLKEGHFQVAAPTHNLPVLRLLLSLPKLPQPSTPARLLHERSQLLKTAAAIPYTIYKYGGRSLNISRYCQFLVALDNLVRRSCP